MMKFKDFLEKTKKYDHLVELSQGAECYLITEHKTYSRIPKTKSSYREDSGHTDKMTQKHAHVFAHNNGKGRELYSVNIDGSGHDGSSGFKVPNKHAKHLRSVGYEIPEDNIIESLEYEDVVINLAKGDNYSLIFIKG